jgi:hypothetical protein
MNTKLPENITLQIWLEVGGRENKQNKIKQILRVYLQIYLKYSRGYARLAALTHDSTSGQPSTHVTLTEI